MQKSSAHLSTLSTSQHFSARAVRWQQVQVEEYGGSKWAGQSSGLKLRTIVASGSIECSTSTHAHAQAINQAALWLY
jgi:hypothetical protein